MQDSLFLCLIVNSESVSSARSLFVCPPQSEGIVGADCVVLHRNGKSCGTMLGASVDDIVPISVGCPTVVLLLQLLLSRNVGEMETDILSSMCNATFVVSVADMWLRCPAVVETAGSRLTSNGIGGVLYFISKCLSHIFFEDTTSISYFSSDETSHELFDVEVLAA